MGSSAATAVYPIQVTTPFGADKVILRTIQGEERISGLFQYTLELISADDALDFSQIVGKSVTVAMDLATGDKEYLNGIVGRFVHAGKDPRQSTYFADLHPKLWLLTLASDCRIFQNKSVPDIVKQVLSDHGVTDVKDSLTGAYSPREYCVQYMETDFDFVSRLMEEEGICYFHTHADGKHTLVLADDSSAWPACTGYSSVKVRAADSSMAEEGTVFECSLEQQVVTAKYRTDDYNFEVPATDLLSTADGGDGQQVYEFPGDVQTTDAADSRTKVALEGLEAGKQILRGSGPCRSFRAGAKFTLTGHTRDDANSAWVLRRVSFRGDQSVAFTNSFEAQPVATPYRPPRTTPRPRIYGSQTATVVGKSGEEIWTDKYGRIKVHFHWDQLGKKDENDSCWVRVSQGWAGKQWGALFLPRIGQEVVVSFLEGNPDRPLVTGSVYNAEQTLPYTLPDDQTKSTVKSNSSKGGGGFNEIRFEDKKDSEEIYVHAQKDHKAEILHDQTTTIGNDQTITVKNNRTTTIQEKDETLIVDKGNRTVKVNTGNETHDVKGKRDVTVTDKETHTNKADYEITVSGNFKLKVTGDITIESSGKVSIKSGTTFTNEAGTGLTNKAGTELLNQAGTSLTNKAGTTLENNAGISLTNKASASQTVDGGGMLTLKGGMVKIN
jgi:type VI secretion system secreted protein VgrG